MSWIREVPTTEPGAEANIMRCMSIDPPMLKAMIALGRVVTFGGSTLTRVQEELIATTVSTLNHCRY
jgi:alkylhydroperoxidase family enzyme